MILVELSDGNSAKHSVYGPATRQYYGYRKHGDRFYVWSKDAELLAHSRTVTTVKEEVQRPEVHVQPSDDITSLWGVDEVRADKLREAGLGSFTTLADADVQKLVDLLEVSESTAKRIKTEAGKVADSVE